MARTQVSSEEILDDSVADVDLVEDLRQAIIENKTAGWHNVASGEVVRNVKDKISLVSKFEKQKGFISHKGYIKGRA